MSKSTVSSFIAAIGFALIGTMAFGSTVPGSDFKIGKWSGSARTRETGEFSFCTVRREFSDGVELSVARSPEGVLLLSVKTPQLAFNPSETYLAKISVDDGELRLQHAMAISSDTMLFAFPPDVGIIYSALFSNGTVLNVESEKGRRQFDIAGFGVVTAGLSDCIDHQGNMAHFASTQAAQSVTPVTQGNASSGPLVKALH